jgi:hypothetical protein
MACFLVCRIPSDLSKFESKIAVLINRDGADLRYYGGKHQREWVHSVCRDTFRCRLFAEKHVANKNPALLKHLDDTSGSQFILS